MTSSASPVYTQPELLQWGRDGRDFQPYETELRVRFTEAFHTIGTREALSPEVLQRRLLLCLYGLGTNAGLRRMCSGGGEDRYAGLVRHDK